MMCRWLVVWQGRDLVYMAAYHGSRPCLEYLLGVFGEQECVNRRYKVRRSQLGVHPLMDVVY